MLKKNKKAKAGPGWFEVILGAILAVILGTVLGAALLMSKTVTKVSAVPKDAPAGAVYFIEGAKDLNRLAVTEKRKAFVGGETVVLEEGELNALFATLAKPSKPAAPATKPGDKAPPPAADAKTIETSALNARIRDGRIQFADTATITLFGVSVPLIVQASGVFERGSSRFEFDPDVILVGGCPMQKLLFVKGWILNKLLFADPAPDDLAAAWSKLSDVSIEGNKLRLKAP